ncbi:MAG: hypothetical protein WCL04_01155 [Verrucomicrobiota bacterium]
MPNEFFIWTVMIVLNCGFVIVADIRHLKALKKWGSFCSPGIILFIFVIAGLGTIFSMGFAIIYALYAVLIMPMPQSPLNLGAPPMVLLPVLFGCLEWLFLWRLPPYWLRYLERARQESRK